MRRHGNGKSLLSEVLVVASLTKTLTESGSLYLPSPSTIPIPLSDSLLRRILTSPTLPPTKKLDFFRWFSGNSKPSQKSLSLIIQTLSLSGFSSHALSLLRDSPSPPNSAALRTLLRSFTAAGDFASAGETLAVIEDLGVAIDAELYGPIVIALVKNRKLDLAVSVFLKILHDCPLPPRSVVCNSLLVGLRKSDMRDEFRRVFDAVRVKEGFLMCNYGYNICISAFGKWGDLCSCMELFQEMKGFCVGGPDLCTYSSMIQVLFFVGRSDDAMAVFEELKSSGYDPNEFTYRIVVHGCSKSYRTNDAVRAFEEMRRRFKPSSFVYNLLIDGLFKARRLTEACQVFEKMSADGVRASPFTYNVLIDGLFKNDRAEAGFAVFNDVKNKKNGRLVDGVTYSIVVVQLCRERLLPMALKLVEEMEERGFVVDMVTITSLMGAMYHQGKWNQMDKLMKNIRDGNLVTKILRWKLEMESAMNSPSSNPKEDYTPMFPSKGEHSDIASLVKSAGTPKPPEEEFRKDKVLDDNKWSPSAHLDRLANRVLSSEQRRSPGFTLARGKRVGYATFEVDMVNTFLSLLLAKRKLSYACKLFEILTDSGVNPVTYTYNSMVTTFLKKGYFDEAWNILDSMGENFCPSDIATYNLIVHGLGKVGRADLASAVVDKLMEEGCILDRVMYNTLINALGKDGRLEEATKLFYQMRASGVEPDSYTFNTIIEVHAKAGQLKDAYDFLKMMVNEECYPTHVTDTILDFLGDEIEKQKKDQRDSVFRNNDDWS